MLYKLTVLTLMLLITLNTQIHSQKQDFVWFSGNTQLGYCCTHFFTFNDRGFVKDFVTLNYPDRIRDGSGKSTISDKEGNLLFYTDGFDVYNRNHQIMLNGDSVFSMEGQILSSYQLSGGVNIPDWTTILPSPAGSDDYYLFYLGIKDDEVYPANNFRGKGLYYSKINMSLDDGLGEVVEKNVNLIENKSSYSGLKAMRHANGRDWWIPVREFLENKWHVFLLDDNGIHLSHVSEVKELDEHICWLVIYNDLENQYFCMTGDHFYPWKSCHDRLCEYQFHIYDFDRCAGTFTYNHTFELETWSDKYSLKSLTLCPNGRYLYGGLGGRYLIQYDTWVDDVQATADTLLNIYTMDNAVPGIYEPKLTPRGEMWLTHWSNDSIAVILNPELRGSDFNISDDFIVVEWKNQGTFPNNANFRIGPIDGSPCDTLGIDNLPKAWFRYNGANIGHFERRFTDASYFRPEHWEWDFDDGTTYTGRNPGVHEFPKPGDYYVCLTVSNENAEDTYCEWVEIEGPSNVNEQLEDRGFVLFPNPNRGQFQIQFSDYLTDEGELRVFNMMGQQLHRETISSGLDKVPLELGHLPSGHYIIQVAFKDEVGSGSLIITR
ncbi:MAG: T9SS C-terminal target domain-containing protein [Saprospirales bacterium]|nr:MAG: T9SS C-terminal target domain-containing protein [Saprospirales bacterium]